MTELETQSLGNPYQTLTSDDVFESQQLETKQLVLESKKLLCSRFGLPGTPHRETRQQSLENESPMPKEWPESQGGSPLPPWTTDAIVRWAEMVERPGHVSSPDMVCADPAVNHPQQDEVLSRPMSIAAITIPTSSSTHPDRRCARATLSGTALQEYDKPSPTARRTAIDLSGYSLPREIMPERRPHAVCSLRQKYEST